jgi:predicted ATPase
VNIGHLLSVCPAVRVLATSREPLHLSWEHEQPVPPLPVPPPTASVDAEKLRTNPAVALFVSRAQAVRPDFRLEPSNSESVAELCRSLDGLPLALELAAARIKSLPPAVLLTRLERRLDVLATPQRDRPARQHALRSAIGWSYDLLASAEQTLFRRLSVFSGGCSLDAAEAVASGDLASVASLIDKNLLRLQEHDQPGAEPRVRMLESVRVYGLEQLVVHGEFHAAHQQLAAACLPLVQQFERLWRGPDPQFWLNRLDVEHDNLRTALNWSTSEGGNAEIGLQLAGGLWWFWVLRGYLTEGRAWLARALVSPGAAVPTAARATALNAAGYLAIVHGETASARAPLEQSLALHHQLADERGIAMSLFGLGYAAYHGDDPSAARGYLEDSLARAEQRRIVWSSTWCWSSLARWRDGRVTWSAPSI